MAKIVKKKFEFSVDSLEGIDHFEVYAQKDATEIDVETAPHISIPITTGQLIYVVELPNADLGITEGTYLLGAASADGNGNETDPTIMQQAFDFIPPQNKPKNLRVY